MSKEMKDQVEWKEVRKSLTFKLTQEDVANKGKAAAELARELGEIEAEFVTVKENFKGKIAAKAADISGHMRTIRRGEEERDVDCKMIKNFTQNLVQYEYQGKVMAERAMEPGERQQNLLPMRTPKQIAEDFRADQAEA